MHKILFAAPHSEKELICPIEIKSQELLLQGQTAVIKGRLEEGCRFFEEACELKSNNPKLFFEQGLSLFEFGTEEGSEKTLFIANKKLKTAVFLLPEYFEAWLVWGMSLAHLGKAYQRHHYFLEAMEKLQKAMDLQQGKSPEMLADLYREFAQVQVEIAKHSKEAHDWYLAMEAFETSSQYSHQDDPDFWNAYGFTCFSLAKQVNDIRLCVKAIHHFKHALSYESQNYNAWQNLSLAMSFLYESTHDEDHFTQSNECFAACAQIYPLAENLWLQWATFLCKSGRNTSDVKRIRLAIEKCMKAREVNNTSWTSVVCLGEALSLLGEMTDNIEPICEGQNKLLDAVEAISDNPEAWRALGESFVSMGKYFGEHDYLYQAIEKFQEGLSLNRAYDSLWFSMANAYTLVGTILGETEPFEQAANFYRKAIFLQPRSSYYRFAYAHCLSKLGETSQEESWLEMALAEFEQIFQIQKNALYLHPDWLFEYAKTLDLYAEFFEEELYYHKAIESLSHVLMIDPDFPHIHYQLAMVHSHLGELSGELDSFYKALHYFKLAAKHEEENDQISVDLAVTLINIAQGSSDGLEVEICYKDAEAKLIQAMKAGNLQAYYQLAGLYSLLRQPERSLAFLMKTESFQALPSIEEILEDEWLDYVRSTEEFQNFIHYLEKKSRQHEEL